MNKLLNNIFKTTTWEWQELWLFKAAVFFIGILFGVYFPAFCQTIMPLVVLGGVGGGLYATYVWLKKVTV